MTPRSDDTKGIYTHMLFRSNHYSSAVTQTTNALQTANQTLVVTRFAMLLRMPISDLRTSFVRETKARCQPKQSTLPYYDPWRSNVRMGRRRSMIPVALKDETLKEEIIARILISVKDRVKASTRVSIDIDASKLSFFPDDQKLFSDKHLRPYSLIIELSIVPMKKHDAAGSEDVEPPMKKSRKSRMESVSLDVGNPGRVVKAGALAAMPLRTDT